MVSGYDKHPPEPPEPPRAMGGVVRRRRFLHGGVRRTDLDPELMCGRFTGFHTCAKSMRCIG